MLPLAVPNPAKKHILIVEDGPLLRRLLCQLLERLDYNVTTAANGREGIERYREQEPDLVITDLFMPEMDGLELIQKLSAEFPDARIINGDATWLKPTGIGRRSSGTAASDTGQGTPFRPRNPHRRQSGNLLPNTGRGDCAQRRLGGVPHTGGRRLPSVV
jgi:hypothetical protein